LASSVAELAESSDILISCLFSDTQLRETGLGPDGFVERAQPGAIFVSHTTGMPATLNQLSESASSPPTIIDAPVSGTADRIMRGTLTVLIGGPAHSVERVKPILAAYADIIIPTGELGTALHIKLVNNVLFAANAQLLAAAVTVGKRLGIAPSALLEALSVSSGSSYATEYAARTGMESVAENAGPFLRKDVAAALAATEHLGIDLGLLRSVIESGPLTLLEDM
jgi:3-hydroxyisobutyrate dehydrogenase-like beta-hydroxyacid dehydrogenase